MQKTGVSTAGMFPVPAKASYSRVNIQIPFLDEYPVDIKPPDGLLNPSDDLGEGDLKVRGQTPSLHGELEVTFLGRGRFREELANFHRVS